MWDWNHWSQSYFFATLVEKPGFSNVHLHPINHTTYGNRDYSPSVFSDKRMTNFRKNSRISRDIFLPDRTRTIHHFESSDTMIHRLAGAALNHPSIGIYNERWKFPAPLKGPRGKWADIYIFLYGGADHNGSATAKNAEKIMKLMINHRVFTPGGRPGMAASRLRALCEGMRVRRWWITMIMC